MPRPTLRAALVCCALAAAAAGAAADSAAAHGPCGCTFPVVARPGQEVTTGPAYRIVLNPPAGLFRGGAGSPELASGYRAGAPTWEVLRRPRPRWPRRAPRGRFRVPDDTPPGIYLLLIFDGSEGGEHATFDYLHVPDPPLSAEHGELHEVLAALARVLPPL
jgi:hypothetical protein